MTERLLDRSRHVVAIEMDRELVAHVRERWPEDPRLELVEGNALEIDWTQWGPGVLAGNLPYYVATAIISKYLANPGELRQAVFLIQKEVAERVTARPGTRDFGYLSVSCQYLAATEYLFGVSPVIRLTPRPDVNREEAPTFLEFASVCFRQKRKTLRNNLSSRHPAEILAALPASSMRAEQLSVAELVELFRKLG